MPVWALDLGKQYPCFDLNASRGHSFGVPYLKFSKYPSNSWSGPEYYLGTASQLTSLVLHGFWSLETPTSTFFYIPVIGAYPESWQHHLPGWKTLSPDQNLYGPWSLFMPFGAFPNHLHSSQLSDRGWWDALRNSGALACNIVPGLVPEGQSGEQIFSAGHHTISLARSQRLGCQHGADTSIFCVSHFHRTQVSSRLWATNNSLLTFGLELWVPACHLQSTASLFCVPPTFGIQSGHTPLSQIPLLLPINATVCSPGMVSSHTRQRMGIPSTSETALFYLPTGSSLILPTGSDVWKAGVRSTSKEITL